MFFLALLIAYLIIFTILSWKKPRWAVFVILAALQSYAVRFSIAGIPMTLLEGMILLLFTSWIVKKVYFFYYVRGVNYNFKSKVKSQKSKVISNFQFPISNKISQFLNFLISNQKIILPIFLFLLAATISVFVSPDKRAALGIWKAYFIEPILFLIVFVDIFRKDEATPRLYDHNNPFHFTASALSIPALYISLFAIYQKFTGFLVPAEYWQPGYHRVTSFFSYPNAIGLLLAPIVIILIGAVVTPSLEEGVGGRFQFPILTNKGIKGRLTSAYYLFTIILSVLAIIFAKSEGAIIALIAGFFILALFLPSFSSGWGTLVPRKIKFATLALLILIATISAAIYLKYGKQWNELFNNTNIFELDSACEKYPPQPPLVKGGDNVVPLLTKDGLPAQAGLTFPAIGTGSRHIGGGVVCKIYQKLTLQDYSGTLRRNMWKETIEMLRDRPILGAGLAGYQQTVAPYHKMDFVEIYLYPHNIFLNFWSETGLLGLIAFIWLLAIFFYDGLKSLPNPPLKGEGAAPPSLEEGVRGRFSLQKTALLAAIIVLLIHGLVDAPYFKNDLAILFWAIWGMMILLL